MIGAVAYQGLVVAGFGLASVYIAPLAKSLLGAYGVSTTMIIFGIAFLVIVVGLSQFLRNPPAGYVPEETPVAPGTTRPAINKAFGEGCHSKPKLSTPTLNNSVNFH